MGCGPNCLSQVLYLSVHQIHQSRFFKSRHSQFLELVHLHIVPMATATYPPPPPYYKLYKNYSQDPDSAPAPPPPIEGPYVLYGASYTVSFKSSPSMSSTPMYIRVVNFCVFFFSFLRTSITLACPLKFFLLVLGFLLLFGSRNLGIGMNRKRRKKRIAKIIVFHLIWKLIVAAAIILQM